MHRVRSIWAASVAATAALVALAAACRADEPRMFPFVLPWNDASPGITSLASMHRVPAGSLGHVRAGGDGHLYAGSQRILFFGVDIAFGADVPTHEQASAIAARLARFGINIVRFHIMDMQRYPNGILARGVSDTRHLDPEGLDRLDFFVAQLHKRGIYANLNLLNYRPFCSADGLPAEIDSINTDAYQPRHAIGFFDEAILRLQREYARALLTHVNPYTHVAYVHDPGVAFVEINNENGLFHAWLSGWLDALPDVFARQLRSRWNGWLLRRHGADDRLRAAWDLKPEPLGAEMLAYDAAGEWAGWDLQRNAGAEGTITPGEEAPAQVRAKRPGAHAMRISAVRRGRESWHLLLNRPGFGVRAGRAYTLTFWARASAPCSLGTSVYQTQAPWASLGLQASARLTTDWHRFSFTFVATASDDRARVTFGDLAAHLGDYWIAGVSLRPGRPPVLAEAESLAQRTIASFSLSGYGQRSPAAQADWRRFLWETEDRYWQGMYRYLKHDLGLQSLVIGTAVGCSTPVMMAGLDVVDAHAYWQHPQFPGRPWDPENWLVGQRSMVNERGGIVADLALRRVLGKPRAVTEYCHPVPNGYGVEGYLLLAAYAALQDWDYISASRYSQSSDWDIKRIRGFFDIDQHPAKMATLLPAVALFARADVRPAREQVVVALDKERELKLLDGARAWELIHAGRLGVAPETALVHRVAIDARRSGTLPPAAAATPAPAPSHARFLSDTGELCWDLSRPGRGVVTVNAAGSKAVIGWGGGRRFDLGGMAIEPGQTVQDGWSAITVTAMTGRLGSGASQALITATGVVENTKMGWKNPEHTTVGSAWGTAPTLVEGIPARIVFPAAAARVEAWALDERGQRRVRLPVEAVGPTRAAVVIGPRWRTLWYEVDLR